MKSGNKFTYIYLSKREVEIYFRLLTFPDEFGAFPTENVHFPMERTNFSEDFCISRQIERVSQRTFVFPDGLSQFPAGNNRFRIYFIKYSTRRNGGSGLFVKALHRNGRTRSGRG